MSLLRVEINPEMRVHLERGPTAAILAVNSPQVFLVEVENAARTTAVLRLTSPHLADGSGHRDRWLTIISFDGRLSGAPKQTLRLTLQTHVGGAREASFVGDLGQGTQDLGFRAEVPVLFRLPLEHEGS